MDKNLKFTLFSAALIVFVIIAWGIYDSLKINIDDKASTIAYKNSQGKIGAEGFKKAPSADISAQARGRSVKAKIEIKKHRYYFPNQKKKKYIDPSSGRDLDQTEGVNENMGPLQEEGQEVAAFGFGQEEMLMSMEEGRGLELEGELNIFGERFE